MTQEAVSPIVLWTFFGEILVAEPSRQISVLPCGKNTYQNL